MMFLFSLGPVGVKPEIWISAAGESLSLTDQHPFAGPDTNAVSCAGGELGPAAELTVLLAGQLTQLHERRHGAGKLQASFNVSLSTILVPAWNSYRRKKHTEHHLIILNRWIHNLMDSKWNIGWSVPKSPLKGQRFHSNDVILIGRY